MKLPALLCALGLGAPLLFGEIAAAAEIKVLSSNAARTLMEEIAPLFERASGHKLTLGFGTSQQVAKRVQDGEAADLVIITPEAIDQLVKQGKVVDGSRVDVARSFVGIAIRAGAPRPDISTPEALKRTLLAAKSVTFSDPATGAASGVHAVRVFERLGVAAEMKPKYKLGTAVPPARSWRAAKPSSPSSRSAP